MTAEEVALEEFRGAVEFARVVTRALRANPESWTLRAAQEVCRDSIHSLARIIRAIRTEREKDELAALESEVLACCGARRDGYERGRRDALREAIDLCRRTEAGDTNHDWREAAKCCRELIESLAAKAAEEEAGND